MEFVWNMFVAEAIRRLIAEAMQDTCDCIVGQSGDYQEEAEECECEAAALAARLPIYRTVTRNGVPERVRDHAATARIQAIVNDLRDRARRLREAARELIHEARKLREAITNTNRTFNRLHDEVVSTDRSAAESLGAVISDIVGFITRMGSLRDSIDHAFKTMKYGGVYCWAKVEAIISDPDIYEVPWEWVERTLSRSYGRISDQQYALLAYYFTLIEMPEEKERFLNYTAVRYDISYLTGFDVNPNDVVPYTACPRKIERIKAEIDNMARDKQLLVRNHLDTEPIMVPHPYVDRPFFEGEDDIRNPILVDLENEHYRLKQLSELLGAASEIASISQEIIRFYPSTRQFLLHCQGNGPFRITQHPEIPNGIYLSVEYAGLWKDGIHATDGQILLFAGTGFRGEIPILITRSESIHTNPTNLNIPWKWVEETLRLDYELITDDQFRHLARFFGLTNTPECMERFFELCIRIC